MDDILSYIAGDSPDAAERVMEAFLGTTGSLSQLAERGRRVPEVGDRDIREVFVFSWHHGAARHAA